MKRARLRLLHDFRARIAVAATGIAVAACVIVSAISVVRALGTANQDLDATGRQLVDWLRSEVVLGVLAGNRAQVDEQARRFLDFRDVVGIAIYRSGSPFVVVGEDPTGLERTAERGQSQPDALVFRAPIVLEPPALDSGAMDEQPRTVGTAVLMLSRARVERELARTIELSVLVLVGAVILALAAASLTARRIAAPVQRLIEAAERVGAGERDVQVPVASNDDMGRLSATFNRMAAEVRRSAEELEQRVEERTRALMDLNKELEAFSYSVSHDLRAPLRHISGFVELLRDESSNALDAEGRRYLSLIAEAAHRMGSLIDDLLALSRVGRTSLNETEVDLRRMVEEIRRDLDSEANGRAIEWHIGPLPRVRGDAMLLRAAGTNLLSNAVKYTRPRSPARIEIGGEVHEREVVCWVKDNGVGFDMRFVDKLFGAFQRLHRTEEFEGTGIGLATVRRIVQRHGGRVWAEGELGVGAVFYFSLPRAREIP